MGAHRLRLLALVVLASSVGACKGSKATSGTTGTGGAKSNLPPPICHAGGTKWQPGMPAFVDATSKWGLDTIGAQGVRLNAVDFDGDGWTDLVVRLGGVAPDDFTPGGTRTTWLLRNTHDGHFEDVTQQSGIRALRSGDTTKGRPGEVFAWGDVNNDGNLDAFTGNTTDATNPPGTTSELMLNNGDGTFSFGPDTATPFDLKTERRRRRVRLRSAFDRDGLPRSRVVEASAANGCTPAIAPLQRRWTRRVHRGHEGRRADDDAVDDVAREPRSRARPRERWLGRNRVRSEQRR